MKKKKIEEKFHVSLKRSTTGVFSVVLLSSFSSYLSPPLWLRPSLFLVVSSGMPVISLSLSLVLKNWLGELFWLFFFLLSFLLFFAAAGLRCHYRELIHLDTLVEEILPLMNEWRLTLQQHRLSLIQQHTRLFSQASPPPTAAGAPMLASASQQSVDAQGGYPVHPSIGGEGKGAGMHAPASSHLVQYQQRGSGVLSSSFSSASVGAGGGGAPGGASGGRYNGLSSNFFDSIRSFLSQSSMRSGSSASLMSGGTGGVSAGGFALASGGTSSAAAAASILSGGANFLGGGKGHHHHRHPSVELRLLRPSMKAGEAALAAYRKKGGDKGEGVDGHTLVPVQELQVRARSELSLHELLHSMQQSNYSRVFRSSFFFLLIPYELLFPLLLPSLFSLYLRASPLPRSLFHNPPRAVVFIASILYERRM